MFYYTHRHCPGGGGHSTFFWVGVCGPDFRNGGLVNWSLPLKRGACELKISKFGGLWTENFQIWGWTCELKISNFGGLWTENFQIWGLGSENFPFFLKRGACELRLLLEMVPLWTTGEAWKGGLQGRTSPYPLSRSVPPPPGVIAALIFHKSYIPVFTHSINQNRTTMFHKNPFTHAWPSRKMSLSNDHEAIFTQFLVQQTFSYFVIVGLMNTWSL